MNFVTHIGLALGLLLLISLLVWQGVMDIIQLLLTSGWSLLWLPLIWLPSFIPATQGWRILFQSPQIPSFGHTLLAMWMISTNRINAGPRTGIVPPAVIDLSAGYHDPSTKPGEDETA